MKSHSCADLKDGDLVMVWGSGGKKYANLRKFSRILPGSVIEVYDIGGARLDYGNGLPLQRWIALTLNK